MAYASASDVVGHVRNLLNGASAFSATTVPSACEVDTWLSSGCSLINARLSSIGYSAIGTTSAAYELARAANSLYAAWMAERARVNATVSYTERTRADMFKKDFFDHLDLLAALDLGQMGVTRKASGVYFGGISQSDVDTVEADTDRVVPRFSRDMTRHPDRLRHRRGNLDDRTDDD